MTTPHRCSAACTLPSGACVEAFVFKHPDGATLEEVGAEFGVTRERIRQIEGQALKKLWALLEEADPACAPRPARQYAPRDVEDEDEDVGDGDRDRVLEAVVSPDPAPCPAAAPEVLDVGLEVLEVLGPRPESPYVAPRAALACIAVDRRRRPLTDPMPLEDALRAVRRVGAAAVVAAGSGALLAKIVAGEIAATAVPELAPTGST